MTTIQIMILILIGLSAGILSGLFGVGGGVVIVPALVFFLGMTQHGAQGTSIGLMLLPIGILAAWQYHQAGSLNVKYGLIIAGAFLVGGFFGSKIALSLDETLLKRIFGGFMLIISIKLILFPN